MRNGRNIIIEMGGSAHPVKLLRPLPGLGLASTAGRAAGQGEGQGPPAGVSCRSGLGRPQGGGGAPDTGNGGENWARSLKWPGTGGLLGGLQERTTVKNWAPRGEGPIEGDSYGSTRSLKISKWSCNFAGPIFCNKPILNICARTPHHPNP